MKQSLAFVLFALLFAAAFAAKDDVVWGDCPFNATVPHPGVRLECTTVAGVPLSWAEPARFAQNLSLHVTRIVSSSSATAARRHLWALSGGPGSANENTAMAFLRVGAAAPEGDIVALLGGDIELYFPDHRGTSFSAPKLECSNPLAMAECAAEIEAVWGVDGMAQFSVTNAAWDLDHLLRTISAGRETHVYGISYGTFHLQRFLNINHTAPIVTATLDGVVIPTAELFKYDLGLDSAGRTWMSMCAEDEFCAAMFDMKHPYEALQEMCAAAKTGNRAGTCFAKLDERHRNASIADIFGTIIADLDMRQLVPPVVLRLTRCNAADVGALDTFFDVASAAEPPSAFPSSPTLGFNIIISELFGKGAPPTTEHVESLHDRACFTMDDPASTVELRRGYDVWPHYSHDQYYGQFPVEAAKETPILLLNGDVDPATPFSWATTVAKHLEGTKARFVKLHYAPHGSLVKSPIAGTSLQCGMTVLGSFIASNGTSIDTSCTANLAKPDWQGTSDTIKALSKKMFGTENMWGH